MSLNTPVNYRLAKASSITAMRGSALVIAIFIITVVLLLAATLTNNLKASSKAHSYQVLGTRAFAAANAGVQEKLSLLFPLDNTVVSCGAALVRNFNSHVGLENCSVEVDCQSFVHNSVTYFTVTAEGKCEVAEIEVIRTLVIEARRL